MDIKLNIERIRKLFIVFSSIIYISFYFYLILAINGYFSLSNTWFSFLKYWGQYELGLFILILTIIPFPVCWLYKNYNSKRLIMFCLCVLLCPLFFPSINVYSKIFLQFQPPMWYCKTSFNKISNHLGQNMEWEMMLEKCGRPYYYEYNFDGVLTAIYTNGKSSIMVNFYEKNVASIYHGTHVWPN